jgi:CRP/FNR family transcriptional regulator
LAKAVYKKTTVIEPYPMEENTIYQKAKPMEFNSQAIAASCSDCRLSDLCLPYGLQKNEVKQLEMIVKNRQSLRTNGLLYAQSEQSRYLYAVKSGSFRSYVSGINGNEQTIGFYLPGEIMGLDSLQTGCFTCSTIALETSTVCTLPISRLNELCTELPGLHYQMMRVLGKEIASDHDKILLLGHRSAKERIATLLLMLSRRYGALGFSSTKFNLTMRRQDIANFLGLTIETVSRQITDLCKHGVISVRGRGVQINNLDMLTAIVESHLL